MSNRFFLPLVYSITMILPFSVAAPGCAPMGAAGSRATITRTAQFQLPRLQNPFPRPEEIERIRQSAPPLTAAATRRGPIADVDAWDVESTPRPGDPSYEPSGAVEQLLSELAIEQGASIRRSDSLRCFASEVGRFALRHAAAPSRDLEQHLLRACGSSIAEAGHYRLGASGRSVREQDLVREARARIRESLAPALRQASIIGAALEHDSNGWVLVVAFGSPRASLNWTTPDAQHRVQLQGVAPSALSQVAAMITRGDTGFAYCDKDISTSSNGFAFSCSLDPNDASALVQVVATPEGGVSHTELGMALVQRDPTRAASYTRPSGGGEVGVESFIALINERRMSAGMGPLTLAAAQSAELERNVDALIALTLESPRANVTDELAIGLASGWEVQGGTIRDAGIVWAYDRGSSSIARLLSRMSVTPSGRVTLFSPEAQQIAIGLTTDGGAGAVITTYRLFDDDDARADAHMIRARIERDRAALGLAPPAWIGELTAFEARGPAIASGAITPELALPAALDEEGARRGVQLEFVALSTLSIQEAPLPEGLVRAPQLRLGVAVVHLPFAEGRWGYSIVCLVREHPAGN